MKTKHLTILSIAACALIVPLMIYTVMTSPSRQAQRSQTITTKIEKNEVKRIQGENALVQLENAKLPTITNARIRTTVPGARVSAAYMDIAASNALTLMKADARIAGITEIHSMTMRDGVMEMRALEQLEIPAKSTVKLERGGLHMMLLQLNAPINVGDSVPLTLTFRGSDGKTFSVDVAATAEGMEKTPATSEHKH